MATKTFKNPLNRALKESIIFSFDETSNDPVNQTLAAGKFWSAEIANISSVLWDENSTIVDIGTHIGTFSALAASFTKGKVFSIEPDPTNFSFLEKNKGNNGFENQFLFNVAASDKEGEVSFCSNGPSSHVSFEGCEEKSTIVPSKPVDSILEGEKVDFIKIDVEGFELAVLDGLKKTLERNSPSLVFEINGFTLKWFDKTPNDLIRKCENFGYRIFAINNRLIPINSWEPFPFGVTDCLAIKDEKLSKIAPFIDLPLSEKNRREIIFHTRLNGNDDMQGYFNWYFPNFGF